MACLLCTLCTHLTHHLSADDNGVARRHRTAMRISATAIHRLPEVPPVFLQQEQYTPDRLRARVPAWASAGACAFFFLMRCYALQHLDAQAASAASVCQVSCLIIYCGNTGEDPREDKHNQPMFRWWLNVGHQTPIKGIIAFYLYWPKE